MTLKRENGPAVELADGIDMNLVAGIYSKMGRVHVPDFLTTHSARHLLQSINKDIPWKLHFNSTGGVYDIESQEYAALPESKRGALHQAIYNNAVRNFQFLFENFPVSDTYDAGKHRQHYIMRVYEFLNSERFLNFARKITRIEAISSVNAQLTRYQPGHFLTWHDDEVAGSNRVAAYVLGLSPEWRTDWGGILNFIDDDWNVSEGYVPKMNALNIFRVPQKHAVSCVAPFAPTGRVSLSGWFRI